MRILQAPVARKAPAPACRGAADRSRRAARLRFHRGWGLARAPCCGSGPTPAPSSQAVERLFSLLPERGCLTNVGPARSDPIRWSEKSGEKREKGGCPARFRQGSGGKSSGAETPPGKDEAGSKNTLFIIGAVAAAMLVGGLVYWKTQLQRQCRRTRPQDRSRPRRVDGARPAARDVPRQRRRSQHHRRICLDDLPALRAVRERSCFPSSRPNISTPARLASSSANSRSTGSRRAPRCSPAAPGPIAISR